MARDINLVYWGEDDVATFSFPQNCSISIGKTNLIQYIIKKILTLKGSNEFEPTLGSTFLYLPGASSEVFKTNLNLVINDLNLEIKKTQATAEENGEILTDSEKLRDLKLNSFKFIVSTGKWKIKLDVFTEDDEEIVITLPI